MHIIISRTDSIGDVVLTLPLAGLLKKKYADAKISFLGRSYTKPVIDLSQYIDSYLNWNEIENLEQSQRSEFLHELKADWIIHVFPNKKICRDAKKAGIKNRVGTSHRIYHWTTCNKLVSFTRRRSDLHEAQLNCKLLSPLGIDVPELAVIHTCYGFRLPHVGNAGLSGLLDNNRKNIVLHPKSRGSAREWGLENFDKLLRILPEKKFKIFVSGTSAEGEMMTGLLQKHKEKITDLTGKLNLTEFITFLSMSDAIVAASTGPLHIAAALGKLAVGIYPPIKPMHPGRWAPLGNNVEILVKDISYCNDCKKSMDCHCVREISPETIADKLEKRLSD